jgi:hypothetical protein
MVLVVRKKILGSETRESTTMHRETGENLVVGDGMAVVKGHHMIVVFWHRLPPGIALKTGGKSTPPEQPICTDGNSTSSAYPSLAGQTSDYLHRQMKDFKEGRRKNSMMSPSILSSSRIIATVRAPTTTA